VAVIVLVAMVLGGQRITTGETIAPTGDQIAFTIWPRAERGNLYVWDLGSNEIVQLTRGETIVWGSWSPDGKLMALILGKERDLYVLDVDTAEATKIDSIEDGVARASWSPDGQQIAYDGGGTVFVINRDGSAKRELVDGASFDWSPDGEKIVYVALDSSDENSTQRSIFIINADGSDPQKLIVVERNATAPKWSPDGSRILFKTDTLHDKWGGVIEQRLHIANADGGEIRDIDRTLRHRPVHWSPDGSQVLYENIDARSCRFRLESEETECGDLGSYPVWEPLGERFAFIDFDSQKVCVTRGLTREGCVLVPEQGVAYTLGWRPSSS
jgi:Tol biopolymer transport system component